MLRFCSYETKFFFNINFMKDLFENIDMDDILYF